MINQTISDTRLLSARSHEKAVTFFVAYFADFANQQIRLFRNLKFNGLADLHPKARSSSSSFLIRSKNTVAVLFKGRTIFANITKPDKTKPDLF